MKIIHSLVILWVALALAGCSTAHRRSAQPEVQNVVYRPLSSPASQSTYTPTATSFAWPVRGTVVSAFGDREDDIRNKGIDIQAPEGAPVMAAGDGRVVYCDAMMRGFGKTVILDHGNAIQTVYSYNSEILVATGDIVRKGDTIAKAGSTGRARESSLHFEIRKDGEPMNPLAYLK